MYLLGIFNISNLISLKSKCAWKRSRGLSTIHYFKAMILTTEWLDLCRFIYIFILNIQRIDERRKVLFVSFLLFPFCLRDSSDLSSLTRD